MRIVNILFKVHCFRLKYSTAAAGIIVLFCCSPLWGYIPDLHQQPSPVLFSDHYKDPLTEDSLQTRFPRSKFPAVAGPIPSRTGKIAEKIQRMAIAAAGRATNYTPADESVE